MSRAQVGAHDDHRLRSCRRDLSHRLGDSHVLDLGKCVVDPLFEVALGDAFVAGVPVGLDDSLLNGTDIGRNESEAPGFQNFEQLVDGEDRGGRGNVVGALEVRAESLVALEAGP